MFNIFVKWFSEPYFAVLKPNTVHVHSLIIVSVEQKNNLLSV